MPPGNPDDPHVSYEEFDRRFNVLERRISKVERENEALKKKLAQVTSMTTDAPDDAYTPKPADLKVIRIIEELEGDQLGASMDAIKTHAADRGLLKSAAKIKVNELVSEGYVKRTPKDRHRVVEWPEGSEATPEDTFSEDLTN